MGKQTKNTVVGNLNTERKPERVKATEYKLWDGRGLSEFEF